MTQDYIAFPEIVDELRRLCSQRVTGTLFIATKANRSAQVAIERGNIVFIYFYNKRGNDALTLMASIKAGRFRFQEGAISPRRVPLPPTSEVLDYLGGLADQFSQGEATAPAAPAAPAEDSAPVVAASSHPELSGEQKKVLEACLAEYIGPMAAIVCEDHLTPGRSLQEIVEALADEIPTADQATKFRKRVKDNLG